jgi:glutathione S-transferase
LADLPILYSFRRCPYAMRARLALVSSGSMCLIREVKLSDKPAELAAASPKATVPVLQLADGQVLEESLDIMRWALGRSDPEGWLDADSAETERLIAANDGPFKHHLDRYKYPDRHGSDLEVEREKGLQLLAVLDERLRQSANLGGSAMSLADAAILPFVRQYAQVDRPWFDRRPLPALQSWLSRHLASPLFQRIAVRLKPWSPGDPDIRFPG